MIVAIIELCHAVISLKYTGYLKRSHFSKNSQLTFHMKLKTPVQSIYGHPWHWFETLKAESVTQTIVWMRESERCISAEKMLLVSSFDSIMA